MSSALSPLRDYDAPSSLPAAIFAIAFSSRIRLT
jgi:hypothetical protein